MSGEDVTDRERWLAVRSLTGTVGAAVVTIDLEELERAIAYGEHALACGAALEPTLWREAHGELEAELRAMRALLAFRRELEALRSRLTESRGGA
jgi:hypothetical protein